MAVAGQWVRFTGSFDFTPKADRRVTVSYPAGYADRVTAECAKAAIAAGKALKIKAPKTVAEANAVRTGGAAAE